jgi:starch phosphorylase
MPLTGFAADAHRNDGSRDVARAVDRLARRLPEPLEALATIAYNYLWAWTPGGRDLFRALGAHRFALAEENPVRLLRNLPERTLLEAATNAAYLSRLDDVARRIASDLARPNRRLFTDGPVAFLCAEFGVHGSLPVYSGGLGVLAGDLLKEASDQALDLVGVGLLYRRGYFHQRVDLSGWQHEYWIEADPEALPAVRVTNADGVPLSISVPVWDGDLVAHVWRIDVGRVPLYLLDAEIAENTPLERWVSARLYEGTRAIRLAQYALLGVGAVRALGAMGIRPAMYHLNEGHPALATVAVASAAAEEGDSKRTDLSSALASVRERFVFTTHTPVPAGNETYSRGELFEVLGRVADDLHFDRDELAGMCRVHPTDAAEPLGLTPLAIRAARSTNGVSKRHGSVARAMWHEMFPGGTTDDVPIRHVTNAVHVPTWMAPPMRDLLTSHFGTGWERDAADPALWASIDTISDEDLWSVRAELRGELVALIRRKVVVDRLARGEDIDFVEAAANAFDPDYLTIGFARRLATYKRLNLIMHDTARALALLDQGQPVQLVFAGKAHPLDDGAKAIAQHMFELKRAPEVGNRVVFIEDYDMRVAPTIVAGCDVWLNLPRPPLEASGTSGMKAAMNGSLNLSVLDGWWAEGFDGTNGWGIDGNVDPDDGAKDARDADAIYNILEHEAKPLFFTRDDAGLPRGWLERIRASLRTLGPRFSAGRMINDYVTDVYRAP